MTATAADYCSIDMQEFESLAGPSLKVIMQTALDIGSFSTGKVNIDLLAHPTTIYCNVEMQL
jgi:hypothetical protein